MSEDKEGTGAEIMGIETPTIVVSAAPGAIKLNWAYGAAGTDNDTLIVWWCGGEEIDRYYVQSGLKSYVINNLLPETLYRVFAYGVREGVESNPTWKDITTQAIVSPPQSPTNLVAFPQLSLMDLKWSPSINASSYKISFGRAPNSQDGRTETSIDPKHCFDRLLSDTSYWFEVVAVNNAGESEPTRVIERTLKYTEPPVPEPPETPGNLQAAPAITTMQLQWSASARATGYVISYWAEPGGTTFTIDTRLLTEALEKLTANTLYAVQVVAVNAYGESSAASTTVRTLAGNPLKPYPFNEEVHFSEVKLTWGGGAPEYEVYWGLVNQYPAVIGCYLTTRNEDTFQDLLPDTRYFFHVRAKNGSAYSVAATKTLDIGPDRTQPRNVRDSGRTFSDVWLTWDMPEDSAFLMGYEITCPDIPIIQTTQPECIVTGLIPEKAYVFTIQPRQPPDRRPALTASISVKTHDYVPPSRPQRIKLTPLTLDSAELSWMASEDNVGVTGYEVRRNGVAWVRANGTSHTINGLVDGVIDTFEVRASDAANNLSRSAYLTHKYSQPLLPGAPTNFRVKTGLVPLLEWDRPNGPVSPDGYKIAITGPQGTVLPYESIKESLAPVLLPLTRYDVEIVAYNNHGNSPALRGVIPVSAGE
ncbi:hypothetical protein BLL42_01390 [Pseudomonas frederiksbergensis]|uniref:Fibronectin type-III domain-containing protein n=1 Tax=Pseudomonas frederiksbergensis TaxID=104087 RepID=A0A1J0EEC5_9PSED|nr:fibronectin type III domain-containing protein [Pseudomonas frederiksbergensis]APC14453.1 hypothetical protein BLL42_01390 [Pseudomonas frederiksbergensis]